MSRLFRGRGDASWRENQVRRLNMALIEVPDSKAAVLKTKAAAQGLTLEAWLVKLADEGTSSARSHSPQKAVARILELQKRVQPDPEGWTVRDYINHGRP